MPVASKVVDGFHFMPPSLRSWISKDIPEEQFSGHIPWTPFKKSIKAATFALMTSAGISMKSERSSAGAGPRSRRATQSAAGSAGRSDESAAARPDISSPL